MHYDYIILGGGASGLSLAYRMCQNPYFQNKKIAIVEKTKKVHNDRTWCFWEKEEGVFESIIFKEWPRLIFHSKTLSKSLQVDPYKYKMIRGIDFYQHVYPKLDLAPNIDVCYGEVQSIKEQKDRVLVNTNKGVLTGNHVFKSYPSGVVDKEKFLYVDQHFKGFTIKANTDVFNASEATFMDFRISQKDEVRFLYVLPLSKREALVEVAIFSNKILEQKEYDKILLDYISDYITKETYEIIEEEFGVIPMTSYPYWNHNTSRITHIGTGGGVVKASSGYAFQRVQKHSDQIIDCLLEDRSLQESYSGIIGRHFLYDKTLLRVMLKGGVAGEEIFTALFKKKKASSIFKFLDNKTSLLEEADIFRAPPTWPFTKAFFQELGN